MTEEDVLSALVINVLAFTIWTFLKYKYELWKLQCDQAKIASDANWKRKEARK